MLWVSMAILTIKSLLVSCILYKIYEYGDVPVIIIVIKSKEIIHKKEDGPDCTVSNNKPSSMTLYP